MKDMLKTIGVDNTEELFRDIPTEIREGLNLPPPKEEQEVIREFESIVRKNRKVVNFAGCGVYTHYVPSAVIEIASRAEFYTSYTPYQPEISQGMLQVLFEYQSFIAELTGMDVANSSMYDFSTSLGEAIRMAYRTNEKSKVIIPDRMYWEKESVIRNYISGLNLKIEKYKIRDGRIDLEDLKNIVDSDVSCVYAEIPNFYGVIDENVTKIREIINEDVVYIVGVNPLSLAVLSPPAEYGADIVVGEGQILGNPANFGGPLLGIFACKEKFIRKMPGRIIGLTKDAEGRRAFCMILQTREQHIKRKNATSNICTNEALCALMSTVYIALLGKTGLKKLAIKNMEMARKLICEINKIDGFRAPRFSPVFNEFVFTFPYDAYELHTHMLKHDINPGLPLPHPCFPDIGANGMLTAVTELISDDEIRMFIESLKSFAGD